MELYKVELELEHASKKDFANVINSRKKEYQVRLGVPFWLINSKGEIEKRNYITNESTTFSKLNEWFNSKQILTIKK